MPGVGRGVVCGSSQRSRALKAKRCTSACSHSPSAPRRWSSATSDGLRRRCTSGSTSLAVCCVGTNLVIAVFFFHTQGDWPGALLAALLGALQIGLLRTQRTFYMRHRTAVQLGQRILRLVVPFSIVLGDQQALHAKYVSHASAVLNRASWKAPFIAYLNEPVVVRRERAAAIDAHGSLLKCAGWTAC
jgi:hypothetical protein